MKKEQNMTPVEWLEIEAEMRDELADHLISVPLAHNDGVLAMLKTDHGVMCSCQDLRESWTGNGDSYRPTQFALGFANLAIDLPPGRCPA